MTSYFKNIDSGSVKTGADYFSQSNSGTFNNVTGVARAVYDISNILKSNISETEKAQAIQDKIAIQVADYYTGGNASKLEAFAYKHWPGTMEKFKKFQRKCDIGLRIIGELFNSDKWKTEGNRLKDLLQKGVIIPDELQEALKLTRGRSKEELIDRSVAADFCGYKEDGKWVNNIFAQSRDVKDLKAEDIWGYSAFFEKFGNDWLGKFSESERRTIAEKALSAGAVKEHHGTIDIDWGKVDITNK